MFFSQHTGSNSGVDSAGLGPLKDIAVAKSSDLDAINRIRREIGNDPSSPHNLTDIHVGLIAETINAVTFVAKPDGGVIGYLSLRTEKSLQESGDCNLEVFVLPNFQGKGVGSRLIVYAESFAATRSGASRLVLGVLNTNPRARAWYEKLGFCSIENGLLGESMAKAIQRSSGV